DTDIGALDSTLEQTPEVFNGVGMHVASHIFNSMIYDLMSIFTFQAFVRDIGISEKIGATLNMASNFTMQADTCRVRQDFSSDFAVLRNSAALQHAHDNGLARSSCPPNPFPALVPVHVASESTDEGLICLNSPAHLFKRAGLCGKAQTMQHVPGSFLSEAQSAGHFIGTNPVLTVHHHPHGWQPFIEADGGIFHNGSDLDAELLPRMTLLTFPDSARGEECDVLDSTGRTGDTVRPAQLDHKLQGAFGIREVVDSLNQGLGVLLC